MPIVKEHSIYLPAYGIPIDATRQSRFEAQLQLLVGLLPRFSVYHNDSEMLNYLLGRLNQISKNLSIFSGRYNIRSHLANRLSGKNIQWLSSARSVLQKFGCRIHQPGVNDLLCTLFLHTPVNEKNCDQIFRFGLEHNGADLIEKALGVCPDLVNKYDCLSYAIREDYWDVAEILIANEANVNALSSEDSYPMIDILYKAKHAALNRDKIFACFTSLVDSGCQIDGHIVDGNISLMEKVYFDPHLKDFSKYLLLHTRCALSPKIVSHLKKSKPLRASLSKIFLLRNISID